MIYRDASREVEERVTTKDKVEATARRDCCRCHSKFWGTDSAEASLALNDRPPAGLVLVMYREVI